MSDSNLNTRLDTLNAKRVVTGFDSAGKSVFKQVGKASRIVETQSLPGLALVEMWATDQPPILPPDAKDLTVSMTSFVPAVGGTRFRLVQFPGVSDTSIDSAAFHKEYKAKAPGLADSMEAEDAAMHTTPTLDYGVVISGRISLELDDGAIVDLKPGDCVVQNGTRHAWRNKSPEPCVMAFVLMGAGK